MVAICFDTWMDQLVWRYFYLFGGRFALLTGLPERLGVTWPSFFKVIKRGAAVIMTHNQKNDEDQKLFFLSYEKGSKKVHDRLRHWAKRVWPHLDLRNVDVQEAIEKSAFESWIYFYKRIAEYDSARARPETLVLMIAKKRFLSNFPNRNNLYASNPVDPDALDGSLHLGQKDLDLELDSHAGETLTEAQYWLFSLYLYNTEVRFKNGRPNINAIIKIVQRPEHAVRKEIKIILQMIKDFLDN